MMFRSVFALCALWTVTPAGAADLCKMKASDAYQSPRCIQWVFSCGKPTGKIDPDLAVIPFKERMKMLAEANYKIAERHCERFDFEQAEAALRAAVRQADGL